MGRLNGRAILVAEDEPLVGLDIADSLRGEGANVISVHNVKDALARAATEDLSAAVLDINVAGEDCSLICQQLADRSIPFMFHTGYTDVPVLVKWPDAPALRKPSSPENIIKALLRCLAENVTSPASGTLLPSGVVKPYEQMWRNDKLIRSGDGETSLY